MTQKASAQPKSWQGFAHSHRRSSTGSLRNVAAIVSEHMPASQAPPRASSSMRLEHKLRTWQEATHKALRCWLLRQQKPFPQHNQQGSTPAEAAAPNHSGCQSVSCTLHDALARPNCILALAEGDMQGQACTRKGVAHSPEHGDGQVPQCCHSRHDVEPPEHSQWKHLHGNGDLKMATPQNGAGAALESLQVQMLLTRTRGLGAYQRCSLYRDGLNFEVLEVL